jgi:8-oxo-dGTP diphosphatase
LDLLEELERQTNVSHRPAQLYKFNKTKYEELSQKDGKFIFEIRFQQRDSKVEENEKD